MSDLDSAKPAFDDAPWFGCECGKTIAKSDDDFPAGHSEDTCE